MALSPIKSRVATRRSAGSCREQTTGHENIKEGYPSIVLSWNETAVPMIVTVGLHDKSVARSHEGKDSYIVSRRIAQFISGSRWTTNRKVRNERSVSVVRHVNRIPRENRNLWGRGETMPSYTLFSIPFFLSVIRSRPVDSLMWFHCLWPEAASARDGPDRVKRRKAIAMDGPLFFKDLCKRSRVSALRS